MTKYCFYQYNAWNKALFKTSITIYVLLYNLADLFLSLPFSPEIAFVKYIETQPILVEKKLFKWQRDYRSKSNCLEAECAIKGLVLFSLEWLLSVQQNF